MRVVGRKKRAGGEGTVRKHKGGLWEARLPIPGAAPRSFYGKTQKEAIAKRDEARTTLLLGGVAFDAENLTVADYLDQWLQRSVATSVQRSTYRRYEQDVRCHIKPALGNVLLQKLKPAHVEIFKSSLLANGLKPSTARQTLLTLSIALNKAIDWELIVKNPARRVTKPKDEDNHLRCLSAQEAAQLVSSVRGTRTEALYHLALKYGPRLGELLALRWDDVDLERATLTIPRSKTGVGRKIRLAPKTIEVLKRHRKLVLEERVASGPRAYTEHGYVFPDPTGEKMNGWTVLDRLHTHLAQAGLPKIRFHDLRDTAATLMLADDFPLHLVSRILGHKNPAMTLKRYAHVLPEMEERAVEKLDKWAF